MTLFFEPFAPLFDLPRQLAADLPRAFIPAADVVVSDDDVTVVMDVPGLDADDLAIELRDDVLTLHIPKPEARKPHRIEIAAQSTDAGAATEQRELVGATA